jgi:guanylate kinase
VNRLIILSGPSCVGKGPLHAALRRFHPELAAQLKPLVLYNDRPARPGEVDGRDYHFRPRADIERLRGRDRFLVMEVRGDLQALDLEQLEAALAGGDALFEGNPFVGRVLLDCPLPQGAGRSSLFLAPLSRDELVELKDRGVALEAFVTEVMRRKLLRRTVRQKGLLSVPDLQNIERRAASAFRELQEAWRFDHVIPNHDGEDSDNWDAFYHPVGDARTALQALVAVLAGRPAPGLESWPRDLLG